MERRLPRLLAKSKTKRSSIKARTRENITTLVQDASREHEDIIRNDVKEEIKDAKYRSFLDCFELQPVKPTSSNESVNADSDNSSAECEQSKCQSDLKCNLSEGDSLNIFFEEKSFHSDRQQQEPSSAKQKSFHTDKHEKHESSHLDKNRKKDSSHINSHEMLKSSHSDKHEEQELSDSDKQEEQESSCLGKYKKKDSSHINRHEMQKSPHSDKHEEQELSDSDKQKEQESSNLNKHGKQESSRFKKHKKQESTSLKKYIKQESPDLNKYEKQELSDLNKFEKQDHKKQVKKCVKHVRKKYKKKIDPEDIENNKIHALNVEKKQGNSVEPDCSDLNMILQKSSDQDEAMNKSKDYSLQENTALDGRDGISDDSSPVYMFRDVNKVAHRVSKVESPSDLLVTVDLNRHGRKRRYDKLIRNLADGEKNLQINLKEIKHCEIDKEDIDLCVEKMKEKLRVREKKKYEYLINYMRDQWVVDQKSFEDLLPQKVDLVNENAVKQLEANTDKPVPEKRKRGRPRKAYIGEEKSFDSVGEKRSPSKSNKQNICPKKKDSAGTKGFPVKFPKSLLSDSSISSSRQKMEKFRVGIIDKNGTQEFIELSGDTLQGLNSSTSTDGLSSSSDKHNSVGQSVKARSRKKCVELDKDISAEELKDSTVNQTSEPSSGDSGDTFEALASRSSKAGGEIKIEVVDKCPPTTINLPSISTLERDYELVSLSPPCPPQLGDFHTDHFFIPQSSFNQDGKTSIIIVGPFCLVCDPKPRLLLVSPDERKKGPTMILRKKIHSPSSTPPRDFRINKESRWYRIPKSTTSSAGGQQGDPAVVLLDHNYMTPPELRDNVKRYCKAVAKHSANVKFIDARVENITEGEDNYVVTIKGDNMLHQVKNLASPSQAPVYCNKDGMPVIYSLGQVMTPALIKAEQSAKREKLALESQQTGDYTPVMFPLSAVGDVVMEVLIPPGGTEFVPRTKSKQHHISEELLVTDTAAATAKDCREVIFLNNKDIISVENYSGPRDGQEETPRDENEEQQVVIENADAVDSGPVPGLPCCRVCLHLFPSDYMLFTHVRANHPTCESTDSMYLEELRARSHLACPICSNPPAFLATPAKLRRHLRVNHGIERYIQACRFCHAEFVDKHELQLHLELSHSLFPGRRLVSLLKPHQSNQLLRGQRSLLSDYLSCNRCNIVFNDYVSLLSHTLKVHPELNQFNMCRLCDRLFDSNVSLHKHLKKIHEQTHDGALKCPFCPAWLSSMELASIHKVTLHTGAVPVHCPFCGAGYQSLHLMYNHVRSQHLQTEMHVCPECQASYPTSRLLSDHMRKIHVMSPRVIKESSHNTCNLTYCCPFCTMSFIRTYDLAVHVINAHKDHLLPSQCKMCMQSFVSDVVMNAHMSGAHGIDIHLEDSSTDTYVHRHFDDTESVTVVLQDDGEDMFAHNKELEVGTRTRSLLRGHLMDTQDILHSQEADQYIGLDQDTIVYLSDRNHVVTSGELFGSCPTMEDVQLLGEASDDFSLHGVDYLETLTNDSIAVGADVVADVTMDEMNNNGEVDGVQGSRNEDILGMSGQFEIDGVLYELAASHECGGQDLGGVTNMSVIDAADLRLSCDGIAMSADDLAHLLRQQVQRLSS